MKDIREQILDILGKYMDMDWDDCADEILALNWADKILALDMYPKEFVEWIGENELYRNPGKNGKWIFQVEPYIIWKSTDELYNYWKNLPK